MKKRLLIQADQKGFTLVEVIIAVAVLAILSFPLMGYFSNALSTTSQGKRKQVAKLAGQSIVEELTSYSEYEDLDRAVSGGAWAVDTEAEARALASPEPTPTPDPANPLVPITLLPCKYITKDFTVDGEELTAKVKIDFNYSNGGSSVVQYNNYEVPQINALYSEHSVVAVEGEQDSVALGELYRANEGNFPKGTIRSALDRKGIISISRKAEIGDGAKIFNVKVFYHYTFNEPTAKVKTYDSPCLINTEILRDDFDSLYILYDAFKLSEDSFDVDMDPNILAPEQQKIKIYFINQTSSIQTGYRLMLTGSGASKIYTNGFITVGSGSTENKIIKREKETRIGLVTVDIYRKGETTFDEDTRVIRIKSAKGE